MIDYEKDRSGNTGTESLGGNDPILGGVGRADYGSMDWSDMQVAQLERRQEYERESERYDDGGISNEEWLELNVLDATEKALAREAHEDTQQRQELAEALSRQKIADAEYEQQELSRMAESERIQNEYNLTLGERVVYAVGSVRDWLGI
jgi:hypothetical protein